MYELYDHSLALSWPLLGRWKHQYAQSCAIDIFELPRGEQIRQAIVQIVIQETSYSMCVPNRSLFQKNCEAKIEINEAAIFFQNRQQMGFMYLFVHFGNNVTSIRNIKSNVAQWWICHSLFDNAKLLFLKYGLFFCYARSHVVLEICKHFHHRVGIFVSWCAMRLVFHKMVASTHSRLWNNATNGHFPFVIYAFKCS